MIVGINVQLDRRGHPDMIAGELDSDVFIESVGTAEMKGPAADADVQYNAYARLSIRVAKAGTEESLYLGIPVRNLEDAVAKQKAFEDLIDDASKDGKLIGIGGRSVQARVWSQEMDQRMSWKLMGKGLNADPKAVVVQELSFI